MQTSDEEGNDDLILDVDSDVELDESELTASALTAKLSQIRAALKVSNKEKQDNLAGWQRAKADLVNYRRVANEDGERREARARARVVESIIPALDSFESALQEKSWQSVEEKWRVGVERIATQLQNALTQIGVRAYGAAGDTFNPSLHDCMSVAEAKHLDKDNTLEQVLQKGYEIEGQVIRPAKVVVAQYHETNE